MTTTPPPLVSIIIVAYNHARYLPACLATALHRPALPCELVLVDNASDDDLCFLAAHYPQLRIIRSPTNLGFAGGCNLGARHARGQWLVFLNPDTLAAPGWLAALLEPLQRNPAIGMTTARLLLANDPAHLNACGNDLHLSGLTLCRGLHYPADTWTRPHPVSAVSGAACAIASDLFARLGGFDEQFFTYMEDTDLSLRVRLAGYQCLCIPAARIYHAYTLRFGTHKTYYQERNRALLLLKHLHWRTLLLLLPALLLAEGLVWGFVLLREPHRWRNKLRAYLWLVRHWRSIAAARRHTARIRRVSDAELIAQHPCRLALRQVGDTLPIRIAERMVNPCFCVWQRLTMRLLRW